MSEGCCSYLYLGTHYLRKQSGVLRPTAIDYMTSTYTNEFSPNQLPDYYFQPLHFGLDTRDNVRQQSMPRRFLSDLSKCSVLAKLDFRNAFGSPGASTCWMRLRISSMIYIYLVYVMQSVLMYSNCVFSQPGFSSSAYLCSHLFLTCSLLLFYFCIDDLALGGKASVTQREMLTLS